MYIEAHIMIPYKKLHGVPKNTRLSTCFILKLSLLSEGAYELWNNTFLVTSSWKTMSDARQNGYMYSIKQARPDSLSRSMAKLYSVSDSRHRLSAFSLGFT